MKYSDIFRKAWVKTINLQNKKLYDLYVNAGFKYIRKLKDRQNLKLCFKLTNHKTFGFLVSYFLAMLKN